MHLSLLIQMLESGLEDRALLGGRGAEVSGGELGRLARCGASTIGSSTSIVYAGENHPLLPAVILAAAWRGVPYIPINYRLDDDQLNNLISRQPGALVLADPATLKRVNTSGAKSLDEWLESLPGRGADFHDPPEQDDDAVAVVLFTSGTTSEPKAALLRHRHLMAYLLGAVEFGSAADDEAALISVPPYHVAGVANVLSNLFAGRRLVMLQSFDPHVWLATVRDEQVTHAMVVPTMLARVVGLLDGATAAVTTLRTLSYGGARLPERVLLEAVRAFPDTGFVNAYGLTETASTIAVLGPDDHRAAIATDDPIARARLSSVGRVLSTIEVEIRDDVGRVMPRGELGMIFLRGDQVSGEYSSGSVLDHDGWFCTRDRGILDEDDYLFIDGRADDTIIRGGENIAPVEIEDVLLGDPAIAEACVVGLPDEEWGQRIAAAVVVRAGYDSSESALRDLVRRRLRGSKTPELIVFRSELPHTDTGKLLRRQVLADLADSGSNHTQLARGAST